jgi:hypothetical protein
MGIPKAQAQTYDNYAWYGYSGQGDWTISLGDTHIWNSTNSGNWIGQSGYVVQYSTYCDTTMSWPQWYIVLNLARNGTIDNEFNIYWQDPTKRPVVNTRANYTLSTHQAVQEGDYISYYSNNNPVIWYNTAGPPDSAIYKTGNVTGLQVFSSFVSSPEELCIMVQVGWNDPPYVGPDWGNYLYHGFGIVGVGMMALAPLVLVRARGSLDDKFEVMAYSLVTGVIGLGLFLSWIYYT